jgi:hypothetical protein
MSTLISQKTTALPRANFLSMGYWTNWLKIWLQKRKSINKAGDY